MVVAIEAQAGFGRKGEDAVGACTSLVGLVTESGLRSRHGLWTPAFAGVTRRLVCRLHKLATD